MNLVVIDTNIIVSSTISEHGVPADIMELVAEKKLRIYYSDEILDEYKKVLAYKKFDLDSEKQNEIIDFIKKDGCYIIPQKSSVPMQDEKDRPFYDAARESRTILITGNTKHYENLPGLKYSDPASYLLKFKEMERMFERLYKHDM